MAKDYFLKIKKELVNLSQIKEGIKKDDIAKNEKFASIFSAIDNGEGGDKNNGVLSQNELNTFFNLVHKEAKKHNRKKLGDKEYDKLLANLKKNGIEIADDISKDDFLGFIAELNNISKNKPSLEVTNDGENTETPQDDVTNPNGQGSSTPVREGEGDQPPVVTPTPEPAPTPQDEDKGDGNVGDASQGDGDGNERGSNTGAKTTKVVVQLGETFELLAQKFGCTVDEIKKANPDKIVKGKWFRAGDEIVIPKEVDSKVLEGRKTADEVNQEYVQLMAEKRTARKRQRTEEQTVGIQESQTGSSESVKGSSSTNTTQTSAANKSKKNPSKTTRPSSSSTSNPSSSSTSNQSRTLKPDFWEDDSKAGKTWALNTFIPDGKITPKQLARRYYENEGIKATEQDIAKRAQAIAQENKCSLDAPLPKGKKMRVRTTLAYHNKVKEQTAAKQGKQIANALYNDIKGPGTSSTFESNLNRITGNNVVQVLNNYEKHGESLVSAISDELFVSYKKATGKLAQIYSVKHIFACLIKKAKESGVDTTRLADFNKQFDKWCNEGTTRNTYQGPVTTGRILDVNKVNHIFRSVIASINTRKVLTSQDNAKIKNDSKRPMKLQNDTINSMVGMHTKARKALKTQDKNDGWAADLWSGIKNILGTNMSRNEIIKSLNDLKQKIESLKTCKTEQGFLQKFKLIFGVEYSPEAVKACEKYQEQLAGVEATHAIEESFKEGCKVLLNNPVLKQEYSEYKNGGVSNGPISKERVFEREFNNFAEYVGKGDIAKGKAELNKYLKKAKTLDEKWDILRKKALEYKDELHKNTMIATGGIEYNAFIAEANGAYRAAYGSKGDIMSKISEYTASQEAGAAIIKGVVKIGGTIVLSLVPGVGTIGAMAIAAGVSAGVDVTDEVSKESVEFKDLIKNIDQVKSILTEAGIAAAFVGQGSMLTKLLNWKSFLKLPFANKIAGTQGRKIATQILADTSLGAAVEKVQTGEITIGGVAFYALFSAAGHLVALKPKKSNANPPEEKVLATATENGKRVAGGKLGNKPSADGKLGKMDRARAEAAEGGQKRDVDVRKQTQDLPVREQSRELEHIWDDNAGILTIGKEHFDIMRETDISKLRQLKQKVDNWSDTSRPKSEVDAEKLLIQEKIDNRIKYLEEHPELQGKTVESETVDKINESTEKKVQRILSKDKAEVITEEEAKIIDEYVANTNDVAKLEALKNELNDRFGITDNNHVSTVDKLKTRINKKVIELNYQADKFNTVMKDISEAVKNDKGLSDGGSKVIDLLRNGNLTAEQKQQIVDALKSLKKQAKTLAIKSAIKDFDSPAQKSNQGEKTGNETSTQETKAEADAKAKAESDAKAPADDKVKPKEPKAEESVVEEEVKADEKTPVDDKAKPEEPKAEEPVVEEEVKAEAEEARKAEEAKQAEEVRRAEEARQAQAELKAYNSMEENELLQEYQRLDSERYAPVSDEVKAANLKKMDEINEILSTKFGKKVENGRVVEVEPEPQIMRDSVCGEKINGIDKSVDELASMPEEDVIKYFQQKVIDNHLNIQKLNIGGIGYNGYTYRIYGVQYEFRFIKNKCVQVSKNGQVIYDSPAPKTQETSSSQKANGSQKAQSSEKPKTEAPKETPETENVTSESVKQKYGAKAAECFNKAMDWISKVRDEFSFNRAFAYIENTLKSFADAYKKCIASLETTAKKYGLKFHELVEKYKPKTTQLNEYTKETAYTWADQSGSTPQGVTDCLKHIKLEDKHEIYNLLRGNKRGSCTVLSQLKDTEYTFTYDPATQKITVREVLLESESKTIIIGGGNYHTPAHLDAVFKQVQNASEKSVIATLRNSTHIDYVQNGVIDGSGYIVYTRNNVDYQIHFENGKQTAVRIYDTNTGKKSYYTYNKDGNIEPISREKFLELKEASDLQQKKNIDAPNSEPVSESKADTKSNAQAPKSFDETTRSWENANNETLIKTVDNEVYRAVNENATYLSRQQYDYLIELLHSRGLDEQVGRLYKYGWKHSSNKELLELGKSNAPKSKDSIEVEVEKQKAEQAKARAQEEARKSEEAKREEEYRAARQAKRNEEMNNCKEKIDALTEENTTPERIKEVEDYINSIEDARDKMYYQDVLKQKVKDIEAKQAAKQAN